MKNINQYKNICILGAAESGIGAALLANQKGYNVFVFDEGIINENRKLKLKTYNINFEEKSNNLDKILNSDLIIKSPGISEKNEIIKKLRIKNIPIISEIEFAYNFKGNSKIIAITGTNGKSTTTSLIYHIFKTSNLDVAIVGNIGYSFANQIFEKPCEYYIIEVSSFQLDDIDFFNPDVSILLNITEDHLDRYDYNFNKYIESKFKIIQNQNSQNYFIYCEDDKIISNQLSNYKINSQHLKFSTMNKIYKDGAFIHNSKMNINTKEDNYVIELSSLPLRGKHNQYNILASSLASSAMKINRKNIREAIQSFTGLEHRMELVATIKGVDYINDSKATNINSTWYALESMTKKTILILGGQDKGNDYNSIKDLVIEKVNAICCLGIDNKKIIDFFKDITTVYENNNMNDLVHQVYKIAQSGEAVLLSPSCASFDLFKNYEDRGNQFKKCVLNL